MLYCRRKIPWPTCPIMGSVTGRRIEPCLFWIKNREEEENGGDGAHQRCRRSQGAAVCAGSRASGRDRRSERGRAGNGNSEERAQGGQRLRRTREPGAQSAADRLQAGSSLPAVRE